MGRKRKDDDTPVPPRLSTSFHLTEPTKAALDRLAARFGMGRTQAVEAAVLFLAATLDEASIVRALRAVESAKNPNKAVDNSG